MSRKAVTFLMEGFHAQQKPCFVGTAGDINPIGQYYPLVYTITLVSPIPGSP